MNNNKYDSFEDKTIFVKNGNQEAAPWDRTRIIAILMEESGLPFQIAEKIADDVQKAVFSSNLKSVSSSLLRELVNLKLLEYGYTKILNKTRVLGLAVSDVKDAVKSDIPYNAVSPLSPFLSSMYIADTVKSQFASLNVFSEKSVDLHYQGKFHINGIKGIDRLFSVLLDVSKLLNFSYTGDNFFLKKPLSCNDFFRNLEKIAGFLSAFVNSSVTFCGFEKIFKYFECESTKKSIFSDFIENLETVLLIGNPVKLYLKDKDLITAASTLYSHGFYLKSEVITAKENYVPARNIAIYDAFTCESKFIAENITVNLPGIALESTVKGKDFFKQLQKHLENIFSAFSKKGVFIEKLMMVRGRSVFDFLKKLGFNPLSSFYAVSICGLQEAVSLLREKVKFGLQDYEFAFEIVFKLKEMLKELEEKHKIKVLLTDSDQSDISYRFARQDLKFEPYYISKIVKGEIASGGVYYSQNASFSLNRYLDVNEVIDIEERAKEYFDFPFKTIIKLIDFENIKVFSTDRKYSYLMLTQDFSVCYHCNVMESGIYKSCPKCLSENIVNYFYLYSNYAPFQKLNRALRVMMKKVAYYEEFTI